MHHRSNPLYPQRNATDAIGTVDLERRASELVQARVTSRLGDPPNRSGSWSTRANPKLEFSKQRQRGTVI
jgi:hypothetical protein